MTPDGEQERNILAQLKIRRIREIIDQYYNPPDERQIAPENVIERIRAVLKA